jgi:type II secretory pathway pseudopilin PulG
MNKVTICENAIEPSTWQTVETDDVCKYLFDHFNGEWPSSAHIYLDRVARNSDITPYDDAGVERLSKINGHFFVVVYPEGIELIIAIVAIAIAAVAIGVSFLLRPGAQPTNQQQNSANNLLGDRQNRARPGARIPDIFGQLWATPDLLAVPYKTFAANVEYEHCYMCVGRGFYAFATVAGVIQIRDDATPLSQIDGASCNVYSPGNNPNNGGAPDFSIGPALVEPVVNLEVFTGVNGQLLQAPNVSSFNQIDTPGPLIKFRNGGIIETNTGADLTTAYNVGDLLYVGGCVANDSIAHDPAAIQAPVNLGGLYPVLAVSTTQVTIDPSSNAANWAALAAFSGAASNFESASIQANNPFWVGGNTALPVPLPPFWINHPDVDEVWCNFVAVQGSYKVDGASGQHFEVDNILQVGWTPCDTTGAPTGAESFQNVTLFGSHTDQQPKGATMKVLVIPGTGGVLVRAHRISNAEIRGGWQNSDQIQWRDCYIVTDVCPTNTIDFGDVTTIQTLVKATPSALLIKERKFNCLVTRKVPVPSGGALAASTNAADILCAMALDPAIGNLQPTDLDVTEIYAVAGAGGTIQTYFASVADPTKLTQFSYTFDDSTISFEEMAAQLAQSIFCVAFRRGGLLSLSFEKQTANSTLLFNHRNKIPRTETRTVTFGTPTGNDGIILEYIEPNAPNYPNVDSTVSLYFPPDRSAVNPKTVKTVGIRNLQQAMVLGWRLYWKLIGQNLAVQFEATEEAALSVLQDRVLVADNTRPETQDGEVIAQAVLLLTLSQNVTFIGGHTYTIFLQHYDKTVESIGITAGANPNQVNLALAPALPCVTDQAKYAKTTYIIVDNGAAPVNAFLVSEKTAKTGKTFELKAVNYSDAYYQHDLDTVSSSSIYNPCGIPITFLHKTKKVGGGLVGSQSGSFVIPGTTPGNLLLIMGLGISKNALFSSAIFNSVTANHDTLIPINNVTFNDAATGISESVALKMWYCVCTGANTLISYTMSQTEAGGAGAPPYFDGEFYAVEVNAGTVGWALFNQGTSFSNAIVLANGPSIVGPSATEQVHFSWFSDPYGAIGACFSSSAGSLFITFITWFASGFIFPNGGQWQASTVYNVNDVIYDSANHQQRVSAVVGDQKSSATVPTFNHVGGNTTDNHVTWSDQGFVVNLPWIPDDIVSMFYCII